MRMLPDPAQLCLLPDLLGADPAAAWPTGDITSDTIAMPSLAATVEAMIADTGTEASAGILAAACGLHAALATTGQRRLSFADDENRPGYPLEHFLEVPPGRLDPDLASLPFYRMMTRQGAAIGIALGCQGASTIGNADAFSAALGGVLADAADRGWLALAPHGPDGDRLHLLADRRGANLDRHWRTRDIRCDTNAQPLMSMTAIQAAMVLDAGLTLEHPDRLEAAGGISFRAEPGPSGIHYDVTPERPGACAVLAHHMADHVAHEVRPCTGAQETYRDRTRGYLRPACVLGHGGTQILQDADAFANALGGALTATAHDGWLPVPDSSIARSRCP